jgi:GDPmannose 4,6-dehydratase
LLWDSSKARKELGWKPTYTVREMCREMVREDVKYYKQNIILMSHWYSIQTPKE